MSLALVPQRLEVKQLAVVRFYKVLLLDGARREILGAVVRDLDCGRVGSPDRDAPVGASRSPSALATARPRVPRPPVKT